MPKIVRFHETGGFFSSRAQQVDRKGRPSPEPRGRSTPGAFLTCSATRTSTQPPSKQVDACSRLGRVTMGSVKDTDRITVLRQAGRMLTLPAGSPPGSPPPPW